MQIGEGMYLSLNLPRNESVDVYYKQGQQPEISRFVYRNLNGTSVEIVSSNIFVNGISFTNLSDFKWYVIEPQDTAKLVGGRLDIQATKYQHRLITVDLNVNKSVPIAVPSEAKNKKNRSGSIELLHASVLRELRINDDPTSKEDCLSNFTKILDRQIMNKGENHISVAQIHHNMGSLYCSLGEAYYEFAKNSFEKSLIILEIYYPEDHAFLVPPLFNLFVLSNTLDDELNAKKYWNRLIQPKFMYDKFENAAVNQINRMVNLCKNKDENGKSLLQGIDLSCDAVQGFKKILSSFPESSLEHISCAFNLASIFNRGSVYESEGDQYLSVRKLMMNKYGQRSPFIMATFCTAKFIQGMNPNEGKNLIDLREVQQKIVEKMKEFYFFEDLFVEVELIKEEQKKRIQHTNLSTSGRADLKDPYMNSFLNREEFVSIPNEDNNKPFSQKSFNSNFTQSSLDQTLQVDPSLQYSANPMDPYYSVYSVDPYSGLPYNLPLANSYAGWPPVSPYPPNPFLPHGNLPEVQNHYPYYSYPPASVPGGYPANTFQGPQESIQRYNGPQNPVFLQNGMCEKKDLLSLVNEFVANAAQAYRINNLVLALQGTNDAIQILTKHSEIVSPISLSELYFNKGSLFYQLKMYDDAESNYLKALAIQEESFGEDHVFLTATLYSLNSIYRQKEQREKGETCLNRLNKPKTFFDAKGIPIPNLQIANLFYTASLNHQQAVSQRCNTTTNLNQIESTQNKIQHQAAVAIENFNEVFQGLRRIYGEGSPYAIGILLPLMDANRLVGKPCDYTDILSKHMFYTSITMD